MKLFKLVFLFAASLCVEPAVAALLINETSPTEDLSDDHLVFTGLDFLIDYDEAFSYNLGVSQFQEEMRQAFRFSILKLREKSLSNGSVYEIRDRLNEPIMRRESSLKTEFMISVMRKALSDKLPMGFSSANRTAK